MRTSSVWLIVAAVMIVIALPALLYLLLWSINLFATSDVARYALKMSDESLLQRVNETRSIYLQGVATAAQIVGGMILILGLFLTWRNLRATEQNIALSTQIATKNLDILNQGQLTERFTRAIEHLGSERLELRLGGVFALERIALDSNRDLKQVLEVLTAFLRRERAGANAERIEIDIQAACTAVCRLPRIDDRGTNIRLDFSRANLRFANLSGGDFRHADFFGADLSYAYLARAQLQGASLRQANLEKAVLTKAQVADCDFGNSINLSQEQKTSCIGIEDSKLT